MNIALILSGGTGSRMGSATPKQYLEVGGRTIITYSLEVLSVHEKIDAIQIVAGEEWEDRIREWIAEYDRNNKFKGFSRPGKTRQLSIYNGLMDIRRYAAGGDAVLIHDAARPCLSAGQVDACFNALKDHDGVIPVLPMKDTVYQSTDGGRTVTSLLDRAAIFAGQAPEVFILDKYIRANEKLMPDDIMKINGSTEPAVLAGLNMAMIPGDEGNFKITSTADLERFEKKVKTGGI